MAFDEGKKEGDKPAEEIEITPEIIEARVGESCSYDGRLEEPDDIVPRIFLAMMLRSRALVPRA